MVECDMKLVGVNEKYIGNNLNLNWFKCKLKTKVSNPKQLDNKNVYLYIIFLI